MVCRKLLTLTNKKAALVMAITGPPDFTPEGEVSEEASGKAVPYGGGGNAALAMCVKVSSVANDSKVSYDAENNVYEKIGESTEVALRVMVEKIGYGDAKRPTDKAKRATSTNEKILGGQTVTGTCEFSRDRKSMSRLLNGKELYVKGAPELLLPRCDRALLADGSVVALDAALRKTLDASLDTFAKQALRVLALAYDDAKKGAFDKVVTAEQVAKYESGLIFTGLASMLDPPREEVRGAGRGLSVVWWCGARAARVRRDCGVSVDGRSLGRNLPGCDAAAGRAGWWHPRAPSNLTRAALPCATPGRGVDRAVRRRRHPRRRHHRRQPDDRRVDLQEHRRVRRGRHRGQPPRRGPLVPRQRFHGHVPREARLRRQDGETTPPPRVAPRLHRTRKTRPSVAGLVTRRIFEILIKKNRRGSEMPFDRDPDDMSTTTRSTTPRARHLHAYV